MLTETITWRPIAEGLPDAELTVLIACDTNLHSEPVWIGFHDGEAWREANGEPAFVTHWAQLPAAPAGVASVAYVPTDAQLLGLLDGSGVSESRPLGQQLDLMTAWVRRCMAAWPAGVDVPEGGQSNG